MHNKSTNSKIETNYFEFVLCPLCGSSKGNIFLEIAYGALKQKASLDYAGLGISHDSMLYIKKCARCGFVFVNPRVKAEYAELIYVQSKKNVQKANVKREIKDTQRIPLRRALSYFDEAPKELVFFDYGCGFGQSLQIANDLGMKTYGVDVDERRVNACREMGFSVTHPREFNKQFPEVKADILFLQSIIEHVIDIPALMKDLQEKAKKGTVLYVNALTPRLIRVEQKKEKFVKAHFIEHINYFTIKTLDRLMQQYGFIPLPQRILRMIQSFNDAVRFFISYIPYKIWGMNPWGTSFGRYYQYKG